MRGTRLAFRSSSAVMGRASGSAPAAASISASVIGRMDVSGNGRSVPSASTSTTVTSDRILAVVVVLLMFFGPPGRDQPYVFTALGIGHMQDHAFAHAEQIDAFFAMVFAVIDPLHSKGIAESLDRLLEGEAMRTPISGGLVIIPFESIFFHNVLVISSFVKYSTIEEWTSISRRTAYRKSFAAGMGLRAFVHNRLGWVYPPEARARR